MNLLQRLRDEVRLMAVALQYFTRLPVPAFDAFDVRWLSESVRWFPLAGLVVGAIAAGVLWGSAHVFVWPVACLCAVAASLIATGAFHEDGLADTFDALGGHVPRARALEIMRDSRIGTYGAAALAISLLLRWQVLVAMPSPIALAWLLSVHPAARAGAAVLMASLPYVRLDDDAKAKPVAQPMSWAHAACTVAIGLIPALVLAAWRPHWWPWLLASTLALVLVHVACRRWFARRLGGYTGDALGATEQLGEIGSGLAVLAALRLLA